VSVLRKLQPRDRVAAPGGAPTRTGLFVDVETTGLEPTRCEIIELAMVPSTATHDCMAAIELLSRPLPKSGRLALQVLLEQARRSSWRIWAENSPYDLKDELKARGYRWNGEGNGAPKAWYIDVADSEREAELVFLKAEIYRADVDLLVRRIDAHDRFSDRV
jgi:hypothetical protein